MDSRVGLQTAARKLSSFSDRAAKRTPDVHYILIPILNYVTLFFFILGSIIGVWEAFLKASCGCACHFDIALYLPFCDNKGMELRMYEADTNRSIALLTYCAYYRNCDFPNVCFVTYKSLRQVI